MNVQETYSNPIILGNIPTAIGFALIAALAVTDIPMNHENFNVPLPSEYLYEQQPYHVADFTEHQYSTLNTTEQSYSIKDLADLIESHSIELNEEEDGYANFIKFYFK